jgi:hypothetical protein
MSWLTLEEAKRSAFEYRWRGSKSTDPILITDFDIKNVRVVEVLPGDWNDAATWKASERLMRDDEFAAINEYISDSRGVMAIGSEVMQEQGRPVKVRGYIKRNYHEGKGWNATVGLDQVRSELETRNSATQGSPFVG